VIGWIVRLLFVVAGFIASWFVARDALNFGTVQMVIAVFLFTFVVMTIAFWSTWKTWLKHIFKRKS
jgi:hypothetical protein